MCQTFPELETQRDFIQKMVGLEEQRFSATLTVGLNKLDELFSATGKAMPEFNQLARLYDTFGIPRDLIKVALEERGFDITDDQFNQQFDDAIRQLHEGCDVAGISRRCARNDSQAPESL
jgi:alanyl-tRNA synthetase